MQFNDSTNNLGLCQEIDALCDSTTTSYPVSAKTRRVNAALEELVGLIINADGTWQFDDTNYTTNPVGTGTLVEGQSSYTFADEYLDIEWVKVKDLNGYWHFLTPIDQSETDTPLENYLAASGFPVYYDKDGDGVKLYPAPTASAVTLTNGFKVGFKRTGSLFTASDTTKEPGIASPYHILLAYMASLPYCSTYKKDRVAIYKAIIDEKKKDLIRFYSRREKDKRKILSPSQIWFR